MFSTTPATNDPLTGASASFRKKAADSFRLYRHYFMIQLKSAMQYKTSFFLTCMGQFLVSFNVFIGIYFMFRRFHTVKGYSYKEVLLCFGITLMEFGLAEVFARGFDTFASIIGNGVFDRIMVRPRGLIFQVLGQRIEFTRIGRMIQATVMFAYGLAGLSGALPRYLPSFLCWQEGPHSFPVFFLSMRRFVFLPWKGWNL